MKKSVPFCFLRNFQLRGSNAWSTVLILTDFDHCCVCSVPNLKGLKDIYSKEHNCTFAKFQCIHIFIRFVMLFLDRRSCPQPLPDLRIHLWSHHSKIHLQYTLLCFIYALTRWGCSFSNEMNSFVEHLQWDLGSTHLKEIVEGNY